ncbi:beta-galactosidase trimerization domain-containing protein [Priestia koreensis]|uniref:beta-galactosidase trimerization domain-containing protein n=1 Tax=Priestia koreensis TaxID=284581 RepID=UPI003CFE67AA
MRTGFNYHPSMAGCHYWVDWNEEEIREDFQIMSEKGFNIVRFFIFWKDFEPSAGSYNQTSFLRLKRLVELAQEYSLECIPSILTIWMNGQLFDLPWREGRSIWRNVFMSERASKFVEKVACELREYNNIFAYDLGDESVYIDLEEVEKLSLSEAVNWVQTMTSSIRKWDKKRKIMLANDQFSVIGNHNLDPQNLVSELDYIAVHGFPLWSPFYIESNNSEKASNYVPFLTALAKLYGPVLIDEFGLYGASEENRAAYITTSGISSYLRGANTIIGWCWKDFENRSKPYNVRPGERMVGFFTAENIEKPSGTALRECSNTAKELSSGTVSPPQVGVFVSELYKLNNTNDLKFTKGNGASLFYSYMLLSRLHIPFEFTTEALENYKAIIVPSIQHLSELDIKVLKSYVEQGGSILYTPGSYLHGFGGEELFGIELEDFTLQASLQDNFVLGEEKYQINWEDAGFTQIPVVKATSAVTLAAYKKINSPALTVKELGKGKAYYLNAPIELALNQAYSLETENYRMLYKEVLLRSGVQFKMNFPHPEVEITMLNFGSYHECILVNHSIRNKEGTLTIDGQYEYTIKLNGKSYKRLKLRGNSHESGHVERDTICRSN